MNVEQWNIDCKMTSWGTFRERNDFDCKQCHVLSRLDRSEPQPGSQTPTTQASLLISPQAFFAITSTGHLRPSSNHYLPCRTPYNEAVVLWTCAKHVPNALIYPALLPVLEIGSRTQRQSSQRVPDGTSDRTHTLHLNITSTLLPYSNITILLPLG